jgi:hypothetical protein
MAKMTLKQARRLLPNGAKGLAPHAVTMIALRDAVQEELDAANRGENPLTTLQITRFRTFLAKTA